MQIDIRDADPSAPEALACLAAYYQLLAETIEGLTPDMLTLPLRDAEKYRPPTGVFLVAWRDNIAIGCISLRPLHHTTAEVKRLWVAPDARGLGLARRLMRAVEDRASILGYAALKLDTNTALPEAIALYRATGWIDTAPYTSFPANVWLAKTL